MRRKFLQRMMGMMLAGLMFAESGMQIMAAENVPGMTPEIIMEEAAYEDAAGETGSETVPEETMPDGAFSTDMETVGESADNDFNMEREAPSIEAPQELKITNQTDTSVTLSWKTVPGCDGYRIYRSIEATTGFESLKGVETNSNTAAYTDTPYTDAPCVLRQKYYYKVTAYIKNENEEESESEYSNCVDNAAPLTGIGLNKTEAQINKGDTADLTVAYTPSYTTDNRTVTWTSSNESVATVTAKSGDPSSATVTAVGAGEAAITAAVGGITAECAVTVSVPLNSIQLNKTATTLIKDDNSRNSETLTVTYLPNDTTKDKKVTWTSSAPEKVSVTPSAGDSTSAEIKALAAGEAVITATVGDKTAECNVVVRIPASKITLSEQNIELEEEGDSASVEITVTPEDTTDKLTYQEADEGFVDCELKGNTLTITPKGTLGETEITIKAGSKRVVLPVRVTAKGEKEDISSKPSLIPVNAVVINKTALEDTDTYDNANGALNLSLEEGITSATVRAEVFPDNATVKELTWTSSNPSVATVSKTGEVTATGIGNAVITATANNGVEDSIHVIVKKGINYNISIANMPGKTLTLYCNADKIASENGKNITAEHSIMMNPSNFSYEYHSSNTEVATVDDTGKVTAKAPGITVITVLHGASNQCLSQTIEVRRLVEEIKLPEIKNNTIEILKGSKTEIPVSLLPVELKDGNAPVMDIECQPAQGSRDIITASYEKAAKDKTKGTIILTAGEKTGTTTLTMKAVDKNCNTVAASGVSAVSVQKEISITVVDGEGLLKPNTIKLTGQAKMPSDDKQTLTPVIKDSQGVLIDNDSLSIGYSSSDEKIATVDDKGVVTAHKGGKVVITAHILDGSNKKAAYTITVEQRPEEITFDREIYGITKSNPNSTASLTLKPIFGPTSTASTQKKVRWKIVDVIDADETSVDRPGDYFTVSTKGVVSVQKITTVGMKAIVQCESASYEEDKVPEKLKKQVVVQIQPQNVTKVKFNASTVNVVGSGEHELVFTTTRKDTSAKILYTATTSDTKIATIENKEIEEGKVILHAQKYGTVTVTLCADNAMTATCKVTIRPVEKGNIAAKQKNYILEKTDNDANDRVKLEFTDAQKNIIDAGLFTYKSADPNVVYVDENGIAYANPSSSITADRSIAITATLTDDPDKRKAVTNVKVCADKQIARIDVKYYETDPANDSSNTKGKPLASGTTMKWDKNRTDKKFILRIMAYDANGVGMDCVLDEMNVAMSDAQRISYVGAGSGLYKNAANQHCKYQDIRVTAKTPGKFAITITSKDAKKVSRKFEFGIYDAQPVLATAGLGTICTNSSRMDKDAKDRVYIAAQSDFVLLGANGTTIQENTLKVDTTKPIKLQNVKNNPVEVKVKAASFKIVYKGGNKYQLCMNEDLLGDSIKPGTYGITLTGYRTVMSEEQEELDEDETLPFTVETTFVISKDEPKFSDAKVTLNTFLSNDEVIIPLKTNCKEDLTITEVQFASNSQLAKSLVIENDGIDWKLKFNQEKFKELGDMGTISSKEQLSIKLKEYAEPVTIRLTVTTKLTKPVVKQQAVPSIDFNHGGETQIILVDAKKNVYEDYTVALKPGTEETAAYTVETMQDDTVKVTFTDKAGKPGPKGKTFKQKITVQKDEWRSPIELNVSVKAYSGTVVPKVTFATSTLNINRQKGIGEKGGGETYAETKVNISHSNIALKDGEWTIPTSYKYKKGAITYPYADMFKADYEDGRLRISLRNDTGINIPNGTYSFTMTDLWGNDAPSTYPPKTPTIKVVVKETAPTVTVKMSGKLDLINRSTSTLKGSITVKNINSAVKRIDLGEDLAASYYCTQKDNVFTLYARNSAQLKAAKTTGTIDITMTDGTVLTKTITFTPSQTTPKIGTPAAETIYKSADTQTVMYDFNADITEGVKVAKITTVSLPEGLKVQESNGYLFVMLKDKTLKAGTYQIKVNCYLKGAQAITGSPDGKAVQKTISVVVAEY